VSPTAFFCIAFFGGAKKVCRPGGRNAAQQSLKTEKQTAAQKSLKTKSRKIQ
jgi:hypothetical protein